MKKDLYYEEEEKIERENKETEKKGKQKKERGRSSNIDKRELVSYFTSPTSSTVTPSSSSSSIAPPDEEGYRKEQHMQEQQGKQEFCTTQKTGMLYITHMMRSVNGSCVVAESLMYRSLF